MSNLNRRDMLKLIAGGIAAPCLAKILPPVVAKEPRPAEPTPITVAYFQGGMLITRSMIISDDLDDFGNPTPPIFTERARRIAAEKLDRACAKAISVGRSGGYLCP